MIILTASNDVKNYGSGQLSCSIQNSANSVQNNMILWE